MKFLVDAHLPRRLALWLSAQGFDTLHTLDLPLKNATPDFVVNQISLNEERIVRTKDSDFVNSFLIQGMPWKLLLISTGNIRNSDLEILIDDKFDKILAAFNADAVFIELNRSALIIHI